MTTPNIPAAIERLSVASLAPYAHNSRTHSPAQVAQIAASITEFGFTNPILIDQHSTIIACEDTQRRADVAVRRWQARTGLRATLQATGQPFPPDA